MSGVVTALSASITSALAIKPSTVYVLRVENTQTHHVWHIRRCFSEFCDLRERMIVLIDGQSSGALHPENVLAVEASLPSVPATTDCELPISADPSAKTKAALRLLALNPMKQLHSSGSQSAHNSSNNSPAHAGQRMTRRRGSLGTAIQERYPFLYHRFPRRQFFGSRSTKVIEMRTLTLNQFLQEAVWLVREVKMQGNIALYFSLMTQLEAFFECAKHTTPGGASSYPAQPVGSTPPVPFISSEIDVAAKNAAIARAVAARGFWRALSRDDDVEDDDMDSHNNQLEHEYDMDVFKERKELKKTISCFMERDVAERRLQQCNTYYSILQTRASERDSRVTATDAWAARIEIAGICPVEALQRRKSNNEALILLQQQQLLQLQEEQKQQKQQKQFEKQERPENQEQPEQEQVEELSNQMNELNGPAFKFAKMNDLRLASHPKCVS